MSKWLALLVLLLGCRDTSTPSTDSAPRWCPHTDPDSGQRYYTMDCDD